MPPQNTPEVKQQSTWRQQEGARNRDHRQRMAKRLLLSVVFCALMFGFFKLIANPLKAPGTQLVLLSGSSSSEAHIPPTMPFVTADFELLKELAPLLRRTEPENSRVYSPDPLRTRTELQRIADECDSRIDNPTDVVVLYVRADGIVIDDRPVLSWQFDQHWSKDRTLPVKDLLTLLTRRDCATRLLVLDCGSIAWNIESGQLVNNFVAATKDLVQQHGDPAIWVMTSRADFESTFFSRSLGQTVFGKVMADAIAGAADHDFDLSITMNELFRYVNQHTADWIGSRTAKQLSQTPQLLHAGPIDWKNTPELLSLSRTYVPPEQPDSEAQLPVPDEENQPAADDTVALDLLQNLVTPSFAANGLAFVSFVPVQESGSESANGKSAQTAAGEAASETKTDTQHADTGAEAEPKDDTGEDGADNTAPAFDADVTLQSWVSLLDVYDRRDRLNAATPSPRDFAPHMWRLLESEILKRQSTVLFGSESESAAAAGDLAAQWSTSQNFPVTTSTTDAAMRRLAEQWPSDQSGSSNEPTVDGRQQVLSKFRELVRRGSKDELQTWLLKQTDDSEFEELAFAKQVLSDSDLSWQTAVDLLKLRQTSDAAAEFSGRYRLQLQDRLERAERMRLEAERQILYASTRCPDSNALTLILAANEEFSGILTAGELLEQAERLARRYLYNTPSRINDFRRLSDLRVVASPNFELLEEHLECLTNVLTTIYAAQELSAERVQRLNILMSTLQNTQQRLESADQRALQLVPAKGAVDAIQELRIEALGRSALADAESRNHLWAALDNIEPQNQAPGKSSSQLLRDVTISPNRWLVVQRHAKLELLRCRLMICRLPNSSEITSKAQKAYDAAAAMTVKAAGFTDATRLTNAWNTFAAAAADIHKRLANQLTERFTAATSAQDSETLQACLALEPGLFLLPTERLRQLDLPGRVTLSDIRTNAASIHQNDVQLQRTLLAMMDAPAEEVEQLNRQLTQFKHRSNSQSEFHVNVAKGIAVKPGEIGVLPVEITNRSGAEIELQLTVEYNETMLAVQAAPGFHVFSAAEVRDASSQQLLKAKRTLRDLIRTASFSKEKNGDKSDSDPAATSQPIRESVQQGQYPIHASAVSDDPTLVLAPGETRTIPLSVTCLENSVDVSRIILRFESGDQYFRRDVFAHAPSPLAAQPLFVGTSGTTIESGTGQLLSVFPNSTTSYQLVLDPISKPGSGILVELLALGRPLDSPLPNYAVGLAEAKQILAALDAPKVLARAEALELAPGVRLPVTLTAPDATAPPATASELTSPEERPVVDSVHTASLAHGVIVQMTDAVGGRVSMVHFPVNVLHPRRYLETHAIFSRADRVFLLSVEAPVVDRLPEDEIQLSLDFDPPLRSGSVRTVLSRQRNKVTLRADVPPEALGSLRATLAVSDYPAAFSWRVAVEQSGQEIPEDDKTIEIRVVSPKAGTAFQTPNSSMPVELNIIAPPGFPGLVGQEIQVGIDADRDRDLQGESVIDLKSTRGISVQWAGVSDDGRLSFAVTAGPLRISIPSNEFVSQKANLLARISDGRRTVWSLPVPVMFDGAPPMVTRLSSVPAEYQAVSVPLTLFVNATDGDLSGVAEIQAGILGSDPTAFLATGPQAKLTQSSSGDWTGTLDTATLPVGTHSFGVRAIDRVGNASRIMTRTITIVTAEEAARMATEVTNSIRGTVLYGGKPLPGATISVKLEAATTAVPTTKTPSADGESPSTQTDELGNFLLKDVRVGDYVLTAEALVRGLNRIKTFDVKVMPPPATQRLDIELR